MENIKLEQKRLLEENRAHEAKMRKEDAEKMEKQIQTMQEQHEKQLEKAQRAAEENRSKTEMWRDLGNLVGGIMTNFIPMGKFGGLAKIIK